MARWRRWVSRRVAAGFVVALCLVVGTGVPAHAVAGATPNTITAFITAAYHDILDRAPTSSELSAGAQQVAAGHGAQFLAGLVTSGEWVAHIVDRFYTDTLGRPADSDGLAFWEHQIAAGTYTVEQAAAFFYASDEYFARVGQGNDWPWVGDLYTKLLGRAPDASGQTYWTTLAATKGRLFVAAAFYQSLESRQARVTALYLRLLQRFADGGGLDYWAGQVLNTGDLALAPSLATSDEYQVRAQTRTYAAPTETALADTARQPYVHQLTATGGTGPYTWSGTGLPAGLSIDATGLISGTPTAAGSTNPVFTIVDAFGTRTSTSVAMTIDPVGTPRITNALSVSVGGGQTCAVLATGHVVCWGYNRYGQVSGTDRNGTEAASPALVEVPGVGDATAVSAGGNHTCALLSTHHISCWGDNEYGQLGTTTNNGLQDTATPMPAEVPGIDNATQVSAGGFHTCALLTTGQVECWGYNYEGQLGTSTNTQTDTANPTPVPVPAIDNAVQVTAGESHTCALLASGSIDCWGDNAYEELGTNTGAAPTQPNPVLQVPGIVATQVSANYNDTCALLTAGEVECWGTFGKAAPTGDLTTVPGLVDGIANATSVALGAIHACAVLSTGDLTCWGQKASGELGSPPMSFPFVSHPAVVGGVANATQVSVSGPSTCVRLATGYIECWGDNYYGELGVPTNAGTTTGTGSPVEPGTALERGRDIWVLTPPTYNPDYDPMPKINVYLPDELAAAVKEAQLPVSTICQNALERAVLDVKAVRAAGGCFLEEGPLPEWGFMSRFSPRAMQALQVARDQAEAAPRDHVEPEHLLIGVLDDPENLAVRVVQSLGVEAADLKAETAGSMPKPGKAAEGRTPFAAKTKAVLEVAVKEALAMGHNYIGCEHLLLGLVGVESTASEVLTRMGLDQRTLRRTVPSVLAGVVHARQAEAKSDLAAIVERLEAIERRLAG